MHFGAEELMRHRATDQRSSDVIQKTGKNPHHHQQDETALPVMRKILWQRHRHVTFFKMARQQRKTHQQTKQVDEDDPFVLDVRYKSDHARTRFEAGERDFVDRNCHQADKRDTHGVKMKHGDADQRQAEQNEI
jgi:hypothetical protein